MVRKQYWVALLALLLPLAGGQKRILGDIREQKISQVYDEDTREEKVYRRPPTYLIIASRIVRPSSIYQVRYRLFKKKSVFDSMIECYNRSSCLCWKRRCRCASVPPFPGMASRSTATTST
jgi:hypothetical protein